MKTSLALEAAFLVNIITINLSFVKLVRTRKGNNLGGHTAVSPLTPLELVRERP